MSVTIRVGEPVADRSAVLKLFAAHLNPKYDEARYDWLYHDNPAGPGRLWVAVSPRTETIVGTAAAFPRNVWLGGRIQTGWVLGDFCIEEEFRTVGPALRLQRACLNDLDRDGAAFCYDFPNPGMMAIHTRLGLSPLGQMVRLARPLRLDTRLPRRLRSLPGSRLAAATGMGLLRLGAWRRRRCDLVVASHPGRCGEEFTRLARTTADRVGACLDRSAEYLNWRYLSNPHAPHEIITARRDGELVAWTAVSTTADQALLADLAATDAGALGGLIEGAARLLAGRRIATMSAVLITGHPWVETLRTHGFSPRETHPIVVRAAPTPAGQAVDPTGAWLFTYGDRDS